MSEHKSGVGFPIGIPLRAIGNPSLESGIPGPTCLQFC